MDQAARERRAAENMVLLMQERLGDELLIDDFAQLTHYSKFHLCRLFTKVTGVTPGRFLSVLRLKAARQLLLDTDSTVSDISCAVGYSSVGTFTSRFTRSVGLSPSVYRRDGGFLVEAGPASAAATWPAADPKAGSLEGVVVAPPGCRPERVLLATFPTPMLAGRPMHLHAPASAGPWRLPWVREGDWYVAAAAVAGHEDDDATSPLLERQARFVGRAGPIRVRGGETAGEVRIQLHPGGLTDLPMLFAPPRQPLPAGATSLSWGALGAL